MQPVRSLHRSGRRRPRPRRALGGSPASRRGRPPGARRSAPRPWTWLRQVHGDDVVTVRRPGRARGRAGRRRGDRGRRVRRSSSSPPTARRSRSSRRRRRRRGPRRLARARRRCGRAAGRRRCGAAGAASTSACSARASTPSATSSAPPTSTPVVAPPRRRRARRRRAAARRRSTSPPPCAPRWPGRASTDVDDVGRVHGLLARPTSPTGPGRDGRARRWSCGSSRELMDAAIGERLQPRARPHRARPAATPTRITLVAVTKGFGAETVRRPRRAGLDDLGENYAQELWPSAPTRRPARRALALHRPLQRNKVRRRGATRAPLAERRPAGGGRGDRPAATPGARGAGAGEPDRRAQQAAAARRDDVAGLVDAACRASASTCAG